MSWNFYFGDKNLIETKVKISINWKSKRALDNTLDNTIPLYLAK